MSDLQIVTRRQRLLLLQYMQKRVLLQRVFLQPEQLA